MKSLFLCAGEGTRFRPWTSVLPKPALPCMNVPLATFPISWARELGELEVCANVHHLAPLLKHAFEHPSLKDLGATFSDETGKLMGPAGALKLAEKHLRGGGTFLVMNGDEVFLPDQEGLLNEGLHSHRKNDALSTLVVMKHPEAGTTFGAVWADANGRVRGFGKTPPTVGLEPWHFIGAYFANDSVIDLIPSDRPSNIFYDILCHELEKNLVQIHPVQGFWHETGNITDYLRTHRSLFDTLAMDKKNQRRLFLEKVMGSAGKNPVLEKIDRGTLLRFEEDRIPARLRLEGFVALGSGAHISEGSDLRDVVIGENVPAERVQSPSAETLIL